VSSVGKWDSHYANVDSPAPYGRSGSYVAGAVALAGCATVEDWGCGLGWFKQFLPRRVTYVGVDGSASKFADVVDDLATRDTTVDGIFMRHVLEHNYDWQLLLDNALCSFTERMVLVTFTPWTEQTPHEELRFEDDYGVPTLALNYDLLMNHLVGFEVEQVDIESPQTFYGRETIFTIDWP
jgi:hypothetical protein